MVSTTIPTLHLSLLNQTLKINSSGESEDEDENTEFDSDESIETGGVEDETRLHSYDNPQLASEALFLVGRRSRYGRFIQ